MVSKYILTPHLYYLNKQKLSAILYNGLQKAVKDVITDCNQSTIFTLIMISS